MQMKHSWEATQELIRALRASGTMRTAVLVIQTNNTGNQKNSVYRGTICIRHSFYGKSMLSYIHNWDAWNFAYPPFQVFVTGCYDVAFMLKTRNCCVM